MNSVRLQGTARRRHTVNACAHPAWPAPLRATSASSSGWIRNDGCRQRPRPWAVGTVPSRYRPRRLEQATLRGRFTGQFVHDSAVYPFEDARHRDHQVGCTATRSSASCGIEAVVGHRGPGRDRQVVTDGAFERVRERQERQHQVVFEYVEQLQRGLDIEQDVAMAEHHTLWPAGGAGGVHDCRQTVRVARLAAIGRCFVLSQVG